MFTVTRHPNAASFLRRTEAWLMRAEVENNLILGIAAALNGPAYLATAEAGGEVAGCALRTPPHKLLLTRCHSDAMAALAADALAQYPDLAGALGPEPQIDAFAAAWSRLGGARVRRGMRQRLHEIRRVERPAKLARGRLRQAQPSDLDAIVPWIARFQQEIPILEKEDPAAAARRRLKHGELFVWDDGGPVSMAGWGGKTAHGLRVNFVYTPSELRARGYATACVAALTAQLLAQGNSYCCLYTNLANPVSNRIYQRIGYRPVCDFADLELDR